MNSPVNIEGCVHETAADELALLTYSTEANIEAMAEDAFIGWNPHKPMHSLMLATMRVNQKKPFVDGYIAGASPVHAKLARLKADNERLRKTLQGIKANCDHVYPLRLGEIHKNELRHISQDVKQAMQTKGGEGCRCIMSRRA